VFQTFTKRTNEPKLSHLESLLTEQGIPHRRNGESFHAPILEVENSKIDRALDILTSDVFGDGREYDDIPDDDEIFGPVEPEEDDDWEDD
jgi:hypothetical protein